MHQDPDGSSLQPTIRRKEGLQFLNLLPVYLIAFSSSASFAIILPSIWPYLQSLQLSLTFLGIVVSLFSVGQFLSAPFFGYWATQPNHRTFPLLQASLAVLGGASLLYAMIPCLAREAVPVAFAFSRFLSGAAAGNVAAIRCYVCKTHAPGRPRTLALTLVTGIQGVGFVVGPGIGALFSIPQLQSAQEPFPVNAHTAPGYASTALAVVCALTLALSTSEHDTPYRVVTHSPGAVLKDPSMFQSNVRTEETPLLAPLKIRSWSLTAQDIEKRGFFLCACSVFCSSLTFTVFETAVTPYSMKAYKWGISHNGVLFAIIGGLSLAVQLLLLLKRPVLDEHLVIAGLFVQVASMACFTPFQGTFVPYQVFVLGACLLAVGFSISNALIYAVFSHLSRPENVGVRMGILTSVASLARVMGPLLVSPLVLYHHGEILFPGIGVAVLCLAALPLTFFHMFLKASH